MFTKEYKGNGVYVIYKNGEEVKTIEGEGNANAWINDEMRKLKEADKSSIASDPEGKKKIDKGTLTQLLKYAKEQKSDPKTIEYLENELAKLKENTDSLDYYLSVIDSNNMNEDEAYAFLEDQGIPSSQIDTIMNYAFPIKADKDIPSQGMTESEQKLRSLIQQIIKEELDENYETKKDLAQLAKDAQSIEPKAQKLAQALKAKGITDTVKISKYFKEKGITDSDLITRVIDLTAKK
jgi:hypothetical protein